MGMDRQAGDFRNFVVCAGDSRTKREGWQVWTVCVPIFRDLHRHMPSLDFFNMSYFNLLLRKTIGPFEIEVPAQSQKSDRSCIFVLGVMYMCVRGHVYVC